jgi:glycosyltransferase involved in cell wall biosynthesis
MECTNLASQLESIEFDRREDRQIVRILHVVGSMSVGGIETWLMNVLRSIDRDRFQMDFLVHTDQPCFYDEEIRSLGSKVIPCLNQSNPWLYSRNFSRILHQNEPYNVVHSHLHYFTGLVMRIAAKAGISGRIAHSHNDTSTAEATAGVVRRGYRTLMNKWIKRYSTVGLACSDRAAIDLFSSNWAQDSRYQVLFCGLDLRPFEQTVDLRMVRSKLGIPEDALVIGHVGRFEHQKNHAFLIEIAAEVAKQTPNIHLLLIGDGCLCPQIKAQVQEMGLENITTFAGIRSDIAKLMLGAMDVFIFPSLYEGLGLALVEAQSAGLPCVISDAVPTEADIVSALISRVPLSAASSDWAKIVLEMKNKSFQKNTALSIVKNSHFNLNVSMENLIKIYQYK